MSLYGSSSNTKESIHSSERAHSPTAMSHLYRCDQAISNTKKTYSDQNQNNINMLFNTKIGVLAILTSKAMSSPLTTFHSSHMNTTIEARGIIPSMYICDRNNWVGKAIRTQIPPTTATSRRERRLILTSCWSGVLAQTAG
jgi:hypothetical protein